MTLGEAPDRKLLKENPKDAIKIKVPRIVSEVLWKSAQEHRRGNKHLQPMKRESWLLQGLITCGLCGHSFMVQLRWSPLLGQDNG